MRKSKSSWTLGHGEGIASEVFRVVSQVNLAPGKPGFDKLGRLFFLLRFPLHQRPVKRDAFDAALGALDVIVICDTLG